MSKIRIPSYRKARVQEERKEWGMGEEDERTEAAIASTPLLQPNYKPRAITRDQLSKLQIASLASSFTDLTGLNYVVYDPFFSEHSNPELHRRRLQIKSKLKIVKKPKGGNRKSHHKDLNAGHSETQGSIETIHNSAVIQFAGHKNESSSSVQQEDVVVQAPTKHQKLHWGLDTKERWERKANM